MESILLGVTAIFAVASIPLTALINARLQRAQTEAMLGHLAQTRVAGGEPVAVAERRLELQAEQTRILAERKAELEAMRRAAGLDGPAGGAPIPHSQILG